MCRTLAEILGVNKTLLADDIQHMEDASGHTSVDVRLTAEILRKIQFKTKELGLDPLDSTGEELYHALLGLAELHNEFLARKIGAQGDDVEKILPRIRDTVLAVDMPRKTWALKHSTAKRLLKAMPPKKLMKYLGYKSLDSMLKREPIAELYAGLRLVEDEAWYDKFLGQYSKLLSMDFEVRNVEVRVLDTKKWQAAAGAYTEKHHHSIMSLRDIGAVLMLPLPFKTRPGLVITLLPLVLHYVNEVRLYSAYYKLHQMQPSFGDRVATSQYAGSDAHIRLANQRVHWRVVQRHFAKTGRHPEVFEPHLQPEDLAWRKAEEVLYKLEPALHFWHDVDYVGAYHDGRPISFNLLDVSLNYLNALSYKDSVYGHCREGLWNELCMRYIGTEAVERQILKQLDYGVVAELPEPMSVGA